MEWAVRVVQFHLLVADLRNGKCVERRSQFERIDPGEGNERSCVQDSSLCHAFGTRSSKPPRTVTCSLLARVLPGGIELQYSDQTDYDAGGDHCGVRIHFVHTHTECRRHENSSALLGLVVGADSERMKRRRNCSRTSGHRAKWYVYGAATGR